MFRRLLMTLPLMSGLLALAALLAPTDASVHTRRVLLVLIIALSAASLTLAYRRPDHFQRRAFDDGLDLELMQLDDEESKARAELASLPAGAAREECQSRLSVLVARRLKLEAVREERAERAAEVTRKVLACQDAIESDPRAYPSAVQVAAPVDGFDDRIEAATGMPRVSVPAGRQESAVYAFPT